MAEFTDELPADYHPPGAVPETQDGHLSPTLTNPDGGKDVLEDEEDPDTVPDLPPKPRPLKTQLSRISHTSDYSDTLPSIGTRRDDSSRESTGTSKPESISGESQRVSFKRKKKCCRLQKAYTFAFIALALVTMLIIALILLLLWYGDEETVEKNKSKNMDFFAFWDIYAINPGGK